MASIPARPGLLDRLFSDRLIGWIAILLLLAVLAALVRGRPHWGEVPPIVWAHLLLLTLVLVLTPLQLWGVKGTGRHRVLGWTWAGAMWGAALVSFGIRGINDGGFSWIHLLSAWVLLQVPLLVWTARTGRVDRHRVRARMLSLFALGVAGFFTFPFGRMLGSWLLG